MDAILEQKRKGQAQFRVDIDNFLANSIFTKQQQQLSLDVLQQIFNNSPHEGLSSNGKINLQKLMSCIQQSGIHINGKQFSKIFGNKKQLKIQQIFQILKSHDLCQFNLQEEIMKSFFQNQRFSLMKLDKQMRALGYNQLNRKDKQILIECFDYNRDNLITQQDLQQMLDRAVNNRQNSKNKLKEKKSESKKIPSKQYQTKNDK